MIGRSTSKLVFVTLYDGKIGHGIYGGGLGSCDTLSVDNEEKVFITSANVKGNTNVYIKGGQALLTSYWLADTRSWEPASIIEGITYSPQYNHQALKFKINHNIYAGGNIACVVGKDAHLTMEKGLLHDNTQVVYGVNVKSSAIDAMTYSSVIEGDEGVAVYRVTKILLQIRTWRILLPTSTKPCCHC